MTKECKDQKENKDTQEPKETKAHREREDKREIKEKEVKREILDIQENKDQKGLQDPQAIVITALIQITQMEKIHIQHYLIELC